MAMIEKLGKMMDFDKYDNKAIRWLDKGSHYELIFTDDFVTPSSSGAGKQGPGPFFPSFGSALLTDIILDMRDGIKEKEVHVFVGSFGGEVAALNMILQQLLTYQYRVGINLGTACSCGWMLLFACHERYVSPFSQAMYHDISAVYGGKHTELQRNAEFMGRWQKELLKITDTAKVLTEKELELGRTSEVWLTGRELIERGAARDYAEYQHRVIPMPMPCFVNVNGKIYGQSMDGWVRMEKTGEKPLSYAELVKLANSAPTMPEPPAPPADKAKNPDRQKKKTEPSSSAS
ncbi:MAG: ATP-dependent Clp protease proteolytic subunit [Lentisphaeria bacterium]|nr:ATP-dependent Clp protease proteolytic subunit [Lentisphaeria bacterium]